VSAYSSNNITACNYRFNVQPAGLSDVIGVTHYQEVALVFDNISGDGYATNPSNGSLIDRPMYVNVATLMSRMWASFVNDLDPNNHGLTGYPVWPKYDVAGTGVGENMVFDANATKFVEKNDWRLPQMAFLAKKALSQWKH
jgi:carboxylesterase type B